MNQACKLSNVTKDYLTEFHCILDKMIHGMTSAPLSDSISHNFIVQMIPHHQAAIEMSRNLLKYTTCIPLQNIAEQIVEEQTKSIDNMRAIEASCTACKNTSQDLYCYQHKMEQIMKVMFTDMGYARVSNDINNNFMREMIPHHRGAVEMSETTLKYQICPQLVPVLDAIITSQKRGIAQMQALLNCNGC